MVGHSPVAVLQCQSGSRDEHQRHGVICAFPALMKH